MTYSDYEISNAEKGVEGAILVTISMAGIIGNVSLWAIILLNRALRTSSNIFVLCLSGADILVSTINVPMVITSVLKGGWIFSEAACEGLGFLTMLTFIASVMSLGLISINRFMLICHPQKFKSIYTPRKIGIKVACTWVFSAILAGPPLIGWGRYGFLPAQSICFCQWRSSVSYTFFMVGVCFGGPCFIMTFCYVRILQEVRNSRKRVTAGVHNMQPKGADADRNPDVKKVTKSQKRRQDDLRLTASFLVVISVFIISWLPFCITMFISVFTTDSISRFASMATLLLGCANSCYNPLIYGVMNSKFRQGFHHLYCNILFRCCSRVSLEKPATLNSNIHDPNTTFS